MGLLWGLQLKRGGPKKVMSDFGGAKHYFWGRPGLIYYFSMGLNWAGFKRLVDLGPLGLLGPHFL